MAGPSGTQLLDNFNRANESPAVGYIHFPEFGLTSGQVVSNQFANGGGSGSLALWSGSTFGPDAEVFATIAVLPAVGSNYVELLVRITDTGSVINLDGYNLRYSRPGGTDTISIMRTTNAGPTTLVSTTSVAMSAGDQLALRIIGTTLTAWHKTAAGPWTQILSTTDATYSAAGYTGMTLADGTARFDDFGGGDIPLQILPVGGPSVQTSGAPTVTQSDTTISPVGGESTQTSGSPTMTWDAPPMYVPPLLDNFNRADGALGSNWAADSSNCGNSALSIYSNRLIADQVYQEEYWSVTSFPARQMVYLQITALADTQGVGLVLCATNPHTGSASGYEAFIRRAGSGYELTVYKYTGGCTYSEPGPIEAVDFTIGDYFGAVRNGNDIEVYTSPDAVNWTRIRTVTDASFTSGGYIGVYTENGSGGSPIVMDNFGGGEVLEGVFIAPASGSSIQTSGEPTVSEVVVHILPTGGSSVAKAGDVTITISPVNISPTGGVSIQTSGSPTVTELTGETILADGGATTQASGDPTVTSTPYLLIEPAGGISVQSSGDPVISIIPSDIVPDGGQSTQRSGAPVVSKITWVINPPGGPSTQTSGTPVISGSLPPGMTVDPDTGVISGTPLVAGSYAFTVTVTDSSSPFATTSRTYTINVV